jgi:hypothetical protein
VASNDILLKLRLNGQRAVTSGLRGVGDQVDRTSRKVGAFAKGAAFGGIAAGITGLGIGFKYAYGEAAESAKVTAQTNAVIKSTGGEAGITAKHVGDLANRISAKTGVDDEAIQSGENLLLTFKKIRNETGKGNQVFDRATAAALDLSKAGFGSLESTTKQLGKALNDPIKGMSALGRSGVTFSAGQKKAIESMVKSGNLLGAQKLLLKEVESQVKGSAAAQATPLQKLQVLFGNIAETVGLKLLPYINKGATALQKFITGMQQGTGAGGKFSQILKTGFGVLKTLVTQVAPQVIGFAKQMFASFRQAVGPIAPIGNAIRLVGLRIYQVARVVLPGLKQAFKGAFAIIGGIIRTVSAVINGDWKGALKGLKTIASGALNLVKGVFRSGLAAVVTIVKGAGSKLLSAGKTIGRKLFEGVKSIFADGAGLAVDIGKIIANKVIGILNSAIPNKIPVPGAPDINLPDNPIPQFARGVRNFRGGMAVVGERGPEIVNLPRGSDVLTNRESFGGGTGGYGAGVRDALAAFAAKPIVMQVNGREIARANVAQLTTEAAFS